MAEIIRGGIQSVDKGQMEAARSLGLPYFKAMRRVILPQAFLTMLPSMINQFIITLKDTSLISIIGIRELTQNGKIIAANAASMFLLEAGFIGFFGGLIGLILSGIISIVINMIAGSAAGGYYEGISYIPIWLVVISLAFAVLVGMVAGFFPALRAMKLSPLAAIRNE